jgi:hypothetical protein
MKPKKRRRDGKRPIGYLATPHEIARLDRLAREYMSKLPQGGPVKVKRSEAIRYAVKVGLDSIERELGLPPLEPPPDPAPAKRKTKKVGRRNG